MGEDRESNDERSREVGGEKVWGNGVGEGVIGWDRVGFVRKE